MVALRSSSGHVEKIATLGERRAQATSAAWARSPDAASRCLTRNPCLLRVGRQIFSILQHVLRGTRMLTVRPQAEPNWATSAAWWSSRGHFGNRQRTARRTARPSVAPSTDPKATLLARILISRFPWR